MEDDAFVRSKVLVSSLMAKSALRGSWNGVPTLAAVLVLTILFAPIVRWIADPPDTVSIVATETDASVENLGRLARAIGTGRDVVEVVGVGDEDFSPAPRLEVAVDVDVRRSASAATTAGDQIVVDREANLISIELVVERPVEVEVRGKRISISRGSPPAVFPLADQPGLLSNAMIALLVAIAVVAAVFTVSRPVSGRRDHEERLGDMNAIYDR